MHILSIQSRLPAVLVVLVLFSGCASSRLEKQAFEGRRLAISAAYPPETRVLHPLMATGRRHRPTGLLRDEQRALQRLERTLRVAAEGIDVSARLAGDLGAAATAALGAPLVGDPKAADYVLDFRVYDYGLVARPDARVAYFFIEAEALMRDRASGEVLWTERLRRKGETGIRLYEGGALDGELRVVLQEFLAATSERLVRSLRKDVKTG